MKKKCFIILVVKYACIFCHRHGNQALPNVALLADAGVKDDLKESNCLNHASVMLVL